MIFPRIALQVWAQAILHVSLLNASTLSFAFKIIWIFPFLMILFAHLLCFVCEGYYGIQTCLSLLGSSDPPASASQVAEITGVHHHIWVVYFFYYVCLLEQGLV